MIPNEHSQMRISYDSAASSELNERSNLNAVEAFEAIRYAFWTSWQVQIQLQAPSDGRLRRARGNHGSEPSGVNDLLT